jgi:hypothetical protein
MEIKSIVDLLSLIASIASLILAIVAICLSVVFYRLSNEASKSTTEAAKGISASVERLEKLFDKLYSDTFSMMRETVTDMRKHIWPEEPSPEQESAIAEVEGKADQMVDELKQTMEKQLQTVLVRQKLAEEKSQAIQVEMKQLIDRAIRTSRKVEIEAREETLREHLLLTIRKLRRAQRAVTVDDLVKSMSDIFPFRRILEEIRKLREEQLIELTPDELGARSEVRLVPIAVRPVPTRTSMNRQPDSFDQLESLRSRDVNDTEPGS